MGKCNPEEREGEEAKGTMGSLEIYEEPLLDSYFSFRMCPITPTPALDENAIKAPVIRETRDASKAS